LHNKLEKWADAWSRKHRSKMNRI